MGFVRSQFCLNGIYPCGVGSDIIIFFLRLQAPDFVTETFEDVDILLWLLNHLHSLLSHPQDCAENVKLLLPENSDLMLMIVRFTRFSWFYLSS